MTYLYGKCVWFMRDQRKITFISPSRILNAYVIFLRTFTDRTMRKLRVNILYMFFCLLLIYEGQGLEKTLILSTRKSHGTVFNMLFCISIIKQL